MKNKVPDVIRGFSPSHQLMQHYELFRNYFLFQDSSRSGTLIPDQNLTITHVF